MRFIDNNGQVFSMQSFSEFPIGYEFEQTPYIFWIDNVYSEKLSVNNYYLLPIRILVKEVFENNSLKTPIIDISLDSDIFKLYCPTSELGEEITNNDLVSNINDISKLNHISGIRVSADEDVLDTFSIYTFYVICNSKDEGAWSSNILIKLTTFDFLENNNIFIPVDDYCPLTVAGTFIDEIEQLQINMDNIGISLPKDIIKAVYQYQYNTDIIDEVAYNTKLKEYLINHMQLKSECGNYNAVLRAIDWFGWKNKIDVVKHLKTDNEFIEQFINDYFNIEDDIITAYRKFKTTAYMSLYVKENKETEDIHNFNFNNDFWGEGKPQLIDLFNYQITTEHDGINFIKQYYDYNFYEMGLKISCLADMLKKYFLPVHLSIKTAALKHQVFANDIKLLNNTYVQIAEQPIFASIDLYNAKTSVSFDNIKTYYLYKHTGFIDDNFNKFDGYNKEYCENSSENYICIDNIISACIPIYFNNDSHRDNIVYNCNIIFENVKVNNNNEIEHIYLHTSKFSFTDKEHYKEFVIAPQLFAGKTNISYWEDNTFILHVLCNGIWYKKEFSIKIPDFQLSFGSIKYNYESNRFRQIKEIKNNKPEFISSIYLENLVEINNAKFIDEFTRAFKLDNPTYNDSNSNTVIGKNIIYYINELTEKIKIEDNRKYYNRIHIYNLSLKTYNSENKDKLKYNKDDLSIYNDFFFADGSQKYWLVQGDNKLRYDFYLMRDKDNKYYAVFISQDTLSNTSLINENISGIQFTGTDVDNYNFHKVKSDDIFLINRMLLVPDNGDHKFTTDDIVIASIDNINLPYIFSLGTKWRFKNVSIGSEYVEDVTSKTNTAIMSIPNNQVKYAKGFYDVIVTYTIDNTNNISKTLSQRICIK